MSVIAIEMNGKLLAIYGGTNVLSYTVFKVISYIIYAFFRCEYSVTLFYLSLFAVFHLITMPISLRLLCNWPYGYCVSTIIIWK